MPSALPFYPHHPIGRLDLYAKRVALESRCNVSESAFSSLEVAYKQGMDSGCRSRFTSIETNEMTIWLSLLTRSFLTLADQRRVAQGGILLAA